nr:hypothetical protein [Desulfobulbus alkaliphilus]
MVATIGEVTETLPHWLMLAATLLLLLLSIQPLFNRFFRKRLVPA